MTAIYCLTNKRPILKRLSNAVVVDKNENLIVKWHNYIFSESILSVRKSLLFNTLLSVKEFPPFIILYKLKKPYYSETTFCKTSRVTVNRKLTLKKH